MHYAARCFRLAPIQCWSAMIGMFEFSRYVVDDVMLPAYTYLYATALISSIAVLGV